MSVDELKRAGYAASKLKDIGLSVSELKSCGFLLAELKEANLTLSELKQSDFTLAELKEAGFTAPELKEADFMAADLKDVGYGLPELKDAGYMLADLKDVGYGLSELRSVGFRAGDLEDAGYGLNELKDAGFTAAELKAELCCITVADLKDAGYGLAELKDVGFMAADLKGVGYGWSELKDAGFTVADLKQAGSSLSELKGAGYTPLELVDAGFSLSEVYQHQCHSLVQVGTPEPPQTLRPEEEGQQLQDLEMRFNEEEIGQEFQDLEMRFNEETNAFQENNWQCESLVKPSPQPAIPEGSWTLDFLELLWPPNDERSQIAAEIVARNISDLKLLQSCRDLGYTIRQASSAEAQVEAEAEGQVGPMHQCDSSLQENAPEPPLTLRQEEIGHDSEMRFEQELQDLKMRFERKKKALQGLQKSHESGRSQASSSEAEAQASEDPPLQPAIPQASSANAEAQAQVGPMHQCDSLAQEFISCSEAETQDEEVYNSTNSTLHRLHRLRTLKQRMQIIDKNEMEANEKRDGLENGWHHKIPNRGPSTSWSLFEQMKGLSKVLQRFCKAESQTACESAMLHRGLGIEGQSGPQVQRIQGAMHPSETIQVEEGIEVEEGSEAQISSVVEDLADLQEYDSKLVKSIEDFTQKREELNRQIVADEAEITTIQTQMWILGNLLQRVDISIARKTEARNKYDKTICLMQKTEDAYKTLVDALDPEENISEGIEEGIIGG